MSSRQYTKSLLTLSFISSLLSLAMARFSNFLIHSFDILKCWPTSSSVLHVPSLRPYLCAIICFSLGFNSSKINRSSSFNFFLFMELRPSRDLSGIISCNYEKNDSEKVEFRVLVQYQIRGIIKAEPRKLSRAKAICCNSQNFINKTMQVSIRLASMVFLGQTRWHQTWERKIILAYGILWMLYS